MQNGDDRIKDKGTITGAPYQNNNYSKIPPCRII